MATTSCSDNIVHLVLARTPGAPPGTRGISLFIVPKVLVGDDGSLGERNDVALVGINHKMGFRGTVNTAPVFGDGAFTPGGESGAVGYLVGEEHEGMRLMFSMMNDARIGVGLCATALGYTALPEVVWTTPAERLQGRPIGVHRPRSRRCALVDHPDVRRMLLAQKSYVEGALALNLVRVPARRRRGVPRRPGRSGRSADQLLGPADPGGEELAVAVVPGRQRPRHPGARWRGLHPRP